MRSLFLQIFFCSLLFSSLNAQSSSGIWTEIDEASSLSQAKRGARILTPEAYKTLRLDANALKQILTSAPQEQAAGSSTSLPFEVLMSNGKVESFYLTEYTMMEPGLSSQFPSFKTYHGYGVHDPSRRIRLDWTSNGLNAMLQLPEGLAFVKPYAQGDQAHYLSYFERDVLDSEEPFECGTIDEKLSESSEEHNAARAGDCQLRTYRLAVATTGEYSTSTLGASSAGTAADQATVNAHVVTSVNQMNAWYERDITARFILIANQTAIYYFNGSTDPYTNSSSTTMLGENISNLDATIGAANFDIGHVLGNSGGGSGGVAGLGVLCGTSKARGVTVASAGGITQPRFLKVWAHEMGHQFGAGHTQNENCQRSATSAMEPGAGTTILSYVTSACNNQIQSIPDYYFHAISIQQMSARMLSTSCANILSSANSAPTVSAGLDKTVPSSTPLLLSATANDPDGDPLTYTWEQFDNEAATAIPPQPTNTQGPSFRSLPPSSESGRYLPNLPDVLSGITPTWEVLPSVARTMEFRVTVRDNSTNSISCTAEDNVVITTVANGPFSVNTANTAGTTWFEGQTVPISWNVASTNVAPVSCANVDILLSYDGGLTYPTSLATAVPNNGSASVVVPTGITSTARVMVRCSDNIFYNVTENNITIQVASSPTFTLSLPTTASSICPGDPVSIPVTTTSIAGFTGNVTLTTSNVPPSAGASFGSSVIVAGNSTTLSLNNTSGLAPGNYPITITGTSGSIIRSETYTLTVEEPAGTTTLDAPAAGATDLSLNPALDWILKPNATSYTVQVAQNLSFTTLIVDQTVNTNSYTVTPSLQPLSTYYWRVKASTPCGETPWTAGREFTTANCLAPLVQNTPVSISSSGTPTVTSIISVSQGGTIADIVVSNIMGTHTWTADLDVDLIGPGGSPVVRLWNDLCGNSDDFNLSLSDNAATDVASAPCGPLGGGGTFRPTESLSAFYGLPVTGDWTLRIADDANQDGGTLNNWTLEFCLLSSVPLPVEMISFNASAQKDAILLDWKTASEDQNAGFDIERRAEHEKEFQKLAMVEAVEDVQLTNDYDYLDATAKAGVRYYYRLRQNDLDGNHEFSEIRTAMLEGEALGLQVYPNPVRGELSGFLDVSSAVETELQLFDLNGRQVLSKAAVGQQFTMNVASLPAGVYILKARHVGGEDIVRLVVE